MFLIDGGESLGPNIGMFRAAFFRAVANRWSGWPDYKFIESNKSTLNRLVAHRSLRYEADQADLPEVVKITKRVSLTQSTRDYYDEARKAIKKANGNDKVIKEAFLRMRQISSGFLGYKDDELGIKSQIEFKPNPKLEMLISLVQSLYLEHKVLVLHDFIKSGDMICRELKRLGIKYAKAFGHTKDVNEQKIMFKDDPDCNVFVVSTSGAFGLNLQVAQYGIFYESPVSPILRKQMERRWHRQGSGHAHVYCYDLLARGTVDQHIRDFHAAGNDLLKAIIDRKVLI